MSHIAILNRVLCLRSLCYTVTKLLVGFSTVWLRLGSELNNTVRHETCPHWGTCCGRAILPRILLFKLKIFQSIPVKFIFVVTAVDRLAFSKSCVKPSRNSATVFFCVEWKVRRRQWFYCHCQCHSGIKSITTSAIGSWWVSFAVCMNLFLVYQVL